ncbi:MAG: HD domain-containing phosphohydrolase [Myxococcota bacterium]
MRWPRVEDKPRILCVDDEPHVLSGLRLHLRRRAEIHLAERGEEALRKLEAHGPFAVVMSDMRMPGMDGLELLSRVRNVAPDTVRVLLTGHADLNTAIALVNEAGIFRFLTKPCPPPQLVAAVRAAAEQYRLIRAEKVLLEQTLRGSVKALSHVMALTQPEAFGRSERMAEQVRRLAEHVGRSDAWEAEVAALLGELGTVTAPPETVRKLHAGRPLSREEEKIVARIPEVADQLLGPVPRLEGVRQIIANVGKHFDGSGRPANHLRERTIPWGARAIRIVRDFDVLEAGGSPPEVALEFMRGRRGVYDPDLLAAFVEMRGGGEQAMKVEEVPLHAVREGMTFAADVLTANGTLLVARGHAVTCGIIERVRNLANDLRDMPVKVILQRPENEAEAEAGEVDPAPAGGDGSEAEAA